MDIRPTVVHVCLETKWTTSSSRLITQLTRVYLTFCIESLNDFIFLQPDTEYNLLSRRCFTKFMKIGALKFFVALSNLFQSKTTGVTYIRLTVAQLKLAIKIVYRF